MKKLLGLLAGAAMTLAVAFGGTTGTASADTSHPVILAHGYTFGGFLPSAVAMNPLEDYLEAQGYTVYNLQLPGDDNIANAQYITNYAAQHNLGPVHVIGHSMGGIALRYAIKNLGLPAVTYVGIDTPQHGESSGCWIWWDVTAQQMCPNSAFLTALNSDETPGAAFYLALGNRYGTTAYLDGACNKTVAGQHASLPSEPAVQALVKDALNGICGSGLPTSTPTPKPCLFWWC